MYKNFLHSNYKYITILYLFLVYLPTEVKAMSKKGEPAFWKNHYYLEVGYMRVYSKGNISHYENINYNFATNETSRGYNKRKLNPHNAFNIQFGIKLSEQFKIGIEYLQIGKNTLNNDNYVAATNEIDNYQLFIRHKVLLLNANYHFTEWHNFSPYIGLSLGLSHNKISEETINLDAKIDPMDDAIRPSRSTVTPTLGLQLGIQYKLTNEIYLSTTYRFLHLGNIRGSSTEMHPISSASADNAKHNIQGHQKKHLLMLSLGYQF